MSHVDEGALHAYLDGALDEYPPAEAERIRAHLDACAECADRLEAERRVRSDAHAMLGLAAPAVDAPSFEELRAYVERTRRPRESRISRIQRLGWAASVVLALGAGWMIREGQLQTRALDVRQDRVLAPAADMTPPADVTPAADVGPSRGGAPVDEAEGEAVGEAATVEGAGVAESRARTEAAPAETDRARRNVVVSEAPIQSPEASEPAPGVAFEEPEIPEMSAQAARPAVEAEEAEKVDTSDDIGEREAVSLDALVVLGDSDSSTTAAQRVPVPGDTAALEAEDIRIAPTTFEAAEPDVAITASASSSGSAGRANDSPSVSALRTGVSPTSLAPATPAEQPAAEDSMAVEPLLALPGYEVISVTNLGDGTTAWGVRVVQALEDGRRLEVVHLEPEVEPFILPGLAEGWSEVRTRTGRGWVLLRGPLPEAELGTLLQRIFPESR